MTPRFLMFCVAFVVTTSQAQSDLGDDKGNLERTLQEFAQTYCRSQLDRNPSSNCVGQMRSLLDTRPLQSIVTSLTKKERVEVNSACSTLSLSSWLVGKFEALYGEGASFQKARVDSDFYCKLYKQSPTTYPDLKKQCFDPTSEFNKHDELRQIEARYSVTKDTYFRGGMLPFFVGPYHPNAYVDCVVEKSHSIIAMRELENVGTGSAPRRVIDAPPVPRERFNASALSVKKWMDAPNIKTIGRSATRLPGDELFKLASPSVYQLVGGSRDAAGKFQPERQGSAVAISERFALTNCHVMSNPKSSFFLFEEGSSNLMDVRLAAADPESDRCVIEALPQKLHPVRGVRAYESLTVGEPLFAVGNPLGLSRSLTDGLLSGMRKIEKRRLLQTNVAISPGSSGGGLFDAAGYLVAITTGTLNNAQNVNVAIPAEDFLDLKN